MNTFKMTGRVVEVGETVSVGSNGFTKRNFVIDTNPPESQYRNPVRFTLKKDRTALADGLREGDVAEVEFTIDGRRWDGGDKTQYFTDLTAWKVSAKSARRTATAKEVAEAWVGEKDGLAAICREATGKANSREYTPEDWGKCLAAIEGANAAATADCSDLPF